ncbi:MAG: WG repeat-containing protein [Proteobacteria bacterium]|nr:WG repeat-containing protein [Pseudomonadota bacterium]
MLENDRWGFINRDGTYAFEDRWPLVRNFSSGLAAVNVGGQRRLVPGGSLGGHYQYVDATGDVEVEGPFPNPGIFWNGYLATMLKPGEAGIIDQKGRVVARGFRDLRGFYGGLSYAIKDDRAGFVKPDGTWKFELPKTTKVGAFHDGLVAFSEDGKTWGFLDEAGKIVIASRFEQASQFWQKRAPVRHKGKWGFVDPTGKFVGPVEWDSAGPCLEERCPVARGDRWGFVDLAGKLVIEPKYRIVRDFHEGLAAVLADNGKVGYLDSQGAWAIEPQFKAAYDFSFGRAIFVSRQKIGFIDRSGKPVIAPRFDRANRFVDVHRSNEDDRSE